MRVRFFGGLSVATDDGTALVAGRGQQALLLRLAVDAGTTVRYRALAEDVWPDDPPGDPRAALQSLVSRLRRALPPGSIASVPGGYRLEVTRDDVDITRFQDLVAQARASLDRRRAEAALALWTGDVWVPSDGFDWLVRDLLEDRAHALDLVDAAAGREPVPARTDAAAREPAALPVAVTTLVGRGDELAAIAARLHTDRLVTVIGPGGAGKTTLALETARSVSDAVVVELAPVAPGDVWNAIAGAVGRRMRLPDSATPTSEAQRVAEAVHGREVVVVLDNCEHVSREAAEAALALLQMAAGVRVLATSREPLGIAGEAFVDLGPLPAADAEALFAERVRSASGRAPASDERDVAARIVRRLDGLPLAIELAAARSRTLTLDEIAAGLDDRFALLAHGPRLSTSRHRTLRALIDWSWDTLADEERTALLVASVFADGIGANDAGAVAVPFGLDGAAAFDALVDRSLLARRDGRYRMLESVRDYGLDRLRESGQTDEFTASAADVLTDLAARYETRVRGPGLRETLAWFDANEENLAGALRTRARRGDRAGGARLLRSMFWPWAVRERSDDLRRGIVDFSDPSAPLDDEAVVVLEAVALFAAAFPAPGGTPAVTSEQYRARREQLERAALVHPSEVTALIPPLLRLAGEIMAVGEGDAARTWHVEVTDAELAAAPPWARAVLHALRAGAAQNRGDTAALGIESDLALRMFRDIGDPWGTGFASQLRSEWLVLADRLDEALAVTDASAEALDGLTSVPDVLQQRAQSVGILLRLDRLDEARARSHEIGAVAAADGSVRAHALALMTAAQVDLSAEDGAAALASIDRLDLGRQPGIPEQFVAWSHAQRAQALLLCARHDEARDVLRRALALAVGSHDQPIVATVLLAVAGWNAAVGRPCQAREALVRATALRGAADDRDPFHRWVERRLAAAPGDSPRTAAAPTDAFPLGDIRAAELSALLD